MNNNLLQRQSLILILMISVCISATCPDGQCSDNSQNKCLVMPATMYKNINHTCATSCPQGQCFTSSRQCSLPNIDNIFPGNGVKCGESKCDNLLHCFTSDFICINPNSENLVPREKNGGKCLASCNKGHCFNTSFICQLPNADFILSSSDDGKSCTSKCKNGECYFEGGSNPYFCTSKIPLGFVASADHSKCICSDSKCYSKNTNTCNVLSKSFLKELSSTKCVEACEPKTCYNSSFECIDPSKNLNYILNPEQDGLACLTSCPAGQCRNGPKGLCIYPTKDNLLSATHPQGFCVSNCAVKECQEGGFKCAVATQTNLAVSTQNEVHWCNTKCPSNQCYLKDNFTCITMPVGYEILNNQCVCPSNTCFDTVKNTCNLLNDSVLKDSNGNCSLKCQLDECISENFICIKPSTFNYLPSNHSSTPGKAKCLKKCEVNDCFDNKFSCIKGDQTNFIPISNDGGKCLTKCPDTSCYDKGLFVCKPRNSNNLVADSKSKGGECINKCPSLHCFDSQFICTTPKQTLLISNEDNGSNCLSSCQENQCYNLKYHCEIPDGVNIIDNEAPGDACAAKCQKDHCHSVDGCVKPSKGNYLPNSNDGNSCLKECHEGCHDSTFTCQAASRKNLINLSTGECRNECQVDQCYDASFACQNLSQDYFKGDDSKCVSSCSQDSCEHNFICVKPEVSKIVALPKENDGSKCITNCESNQCIIDGTCVSPALNSKFILPEDLKGGVCLPKCENNQCRDEDNKCISPKKGFNLEFNNEGNSKCISKCKKDYCSDNQFNCILPTAELILPELNDGSECLNVNEVLLSQKDGPTRAFFKELEFKLNLKVLNENYSKNENNSASIQTQKSVQFSSFIENLANDRKNLTAIDEKMNTSKNGELNLYFKDLNASIIAPLPFLYYSNSTSKDVIISEEDIINFSYFNSTKLNVNDICGKNINKDDDYSNESCTGLGKCLTDSKYQISCICKIGYCGKYCSLSCNSELQYKEQILSHINEYLLIETTNESPPIIHTSSSNTVNVVDSSATASDVSTATAAASTTVSDVSTATTASSEVSTSTIATSTTASDVSTATSTTSETSTRLLQITTKEISNYSSNFNLNKLLILDSLTSIYSLMNLSIDEVFKVTSIIKSLNSQIDSESETVAKILTDNSSKTVDIITRLFEIADTLLDKSRNKNYIDYIKSLPTNSTLSSPLNITFIDYNSTIYDPVVFTNLDNIDSIYNILHLTWEYDNLLTVGGKKLIKNHEYDIASVSTKDPHWSLSQDQLKKLEITYDTITIFLNKFIHQLTKRGNINELIVENRYFKIYMKEFTQLSNLMFEYKTFVNTNIKKIGSNTDMVFFEAEKLSQQLSNENQVFSLSFVVVEPYNPKIKKMLTASADLKFYRKGSFVDIYDCFIYFTGSPYLQGVNHYVELNKNRFYLNIPTEYKVKQDKIYDYLKQAPYLIEKTGIVNRKYTIRKRINDFHNFINIPESYFLQYTDKHYIAKYTSTSSMELTFDFVPATIEILPSYYWLKRYEIFLQSSNLHRLTFSYLIITIAIFFLGFNAHLIRYLCCKKKKKCDKKLNIDDKEMKNESDKELKIDDIEVSAKDLKEDPKEDYPAFDSSYTGLTFCKAFGLNFRGGMFSSMLRHPEKFQCPKYKEMAHGMLFQLFGLFIFSLLFSFGELVNIPARSDLPIFYLWFSIVAWVCTNLLIFIIYPIFSAPKEIKEMTIEADNIEEKIKETNKKNLIKSLIVYIISLGLFGVTFYLLFGFTIIYYQYDLPVFATVQLMTLGDLLIFEIIHSLIVGFLVKNNPSGNGKLLNIMISFTRMRNGA